MREIRFVDTTLRDGQQSLWAMQMRTDMMLPVLDDLDAAGFDAVEFFIPSSQFVRAVRSLKEDPWNWLRLGPPRMRRTQLRLHGGGSSSFANVPMCIQDLLLERLAHYGITATRMSNPWNDYSDAAEQITRLKGYGIESVVNVVYSVSPRHSTEYYVDRTKQATKVGASRVCFKDVGGLLTPEVAVRLLPLIVEQAGDVPVEFHAHCNNGFAPYNVLLAAEAGIEIIHTAIPPLANGSSQPSVFQVASNLRARGFQPVVDTAPLERVRRHLERIADRDDLPRGIQAEYDEDIYNYQVPGGMISNFRFHLRQAGLEDRLSETLQEIAQVRADLGYPIMVTPLSQFVGTQAVMNVITGTRYGMVTDEVIGYALGHWGREAIDVMDPSVREMVLNRPRAREIERDRMQPVEEPTLAEVRQQYGLGMPDEELILRVFAAAGSGDLGLCQARPLTTNYSEYWQASSGIANML